MNQKKLASDCLVFVFAIFLCVIASWGRMVYAENVIVVCANEIKGGVNKKVFGNNLLGYDSSLPDRGESKKHYYGHADYGSGVWDSKWNESNEDVIKLAKGAGISILRFPGGGGANWYDWKAGTGKKREHFLFGVDEFLKVCGEVGATAVYTVNCSGDNEKDAVDLVEYLNFSAGRVEKIWAEKRAKNGRALPYHLEYFEIGNEVWDYMRPEEYALRYIKYYIGMKSVAPDAKIGVVLQAPEWNRKVLGIVGDKVDFGIIHMYPSHLGEMFTKSDPDYRNIFGLTWASVIIKIELNLQRTSGILKEKSGRDVPLAITEYNGGFVQDKPVPYRHCLGTALLNAELLRIFMKPENNILMANYWNFCNEYWGMVANGFDGTDKTLNKPYYKRPNYYVFELYHKHFGDILIAVDVKCDSYDVAGNKEFVSRITREMHEGMVVEKNLVVRPWQISELNGISAVEKDDVLQVEFASPKQFNYFHTCKHAQVEPSSFYRLSSYIKTENLQDANGVCLEVQDARGWTETHSAAATEKIKGTTDWQYVELIYETLPDATAVNVIARRIGETGPLKGKAYFKDVKLQKFIPKIDTKIPYLSVNTSKSVDGKKVYLMVINKNMEAPMTAEIEFKDFTPAAKGNAWVLNGPSVDATNEQKHDNVKVTHKTFEIASSPSAPRNDERNKFEFTFEPHSLTAIEIEGIAVNAEFSEKVQ